MEKFVPYEKLSKKEQQKINKARRGTWGDLKRSAKVKGRTFKVPKFCQEV